MCGGTTIHVKGDSQRLAIAKKKREEFNRILGS